MGPLERRRSTISRLDDGLLIVVAVVAALFVFSLLTWVIHAVAFIVKVAVIAAVVALVVRAVNRRS
jgi:hypothetical membrane protein